MALLTKFKLTVLFLLLVVATACSSKTFNVNKKELDPFTINVQQPLALPPVYYLSVPEIANERRVLRNNNKTVSELLFANQTNSTVTGLNSQDQAFLNLAVTNKANPQIKQILDKEALAEVKKSNSFINKIFGNNNNYLQPTQAEYVNNSANKQ